MAFGQAVRLQRRDEVLAQVAGGVGAEEAVERLAHVALGQFAVPVGALRAVGAVVVAVIELGARKHEEPLFGRGDLDFERRVGHQLVRHAALPRPAEHVTTVEERRGRRLALRGCFQVPEARAAVHLEALLAVFDEVIEAHVLGRGHAAAVGVLPVAVRVIESPP